MKLPTPPASPTDAGPTRRDLLRTAPAASFALGGLGGMASAVAPTRAHASDGPPPLAGAGVETASGQALYSLPRDHAWHGGAFYQTNEFNEWHYIAVLGRDLDTGGFHTAPLDITGPMTTEGSGPDAKDFHFRYEIAGGENGFTTTYAHATEA